MTTYLNLVFLLRKESLQGLLKFVLVHIALFYDLLLHDADVDQSAGMLKAFAPREVASNGAKELKPVIEFYRVLSGIGLPFITTALH